MKIDFAQMARYEYARRVVNILRKEQQHSVLEVGGGAHGNLSYFLPNDSITFLDIIYSEEILKDTRFVLGDATDLQYSDNSFDFVIALDVMEHVPEEKKELFIKEIIRVAKNNVIIGFPHAENNNAYSDNEIAAFYWAMGQDIPVWCKEHISIGLPKSSDIKKIICKYISEDKVYNFFGVNRNLLQDMLLQMIICSSLPELEYYWKNISEEYIDSYLSLDLFVEQEYSSKAYFIIDKSGDGQKLEKEIVYNRENQSKVIAFDHLVAQHGNLIFNSVIAARINKQNEANREIKMKVDNIGSIVDRLYRQSDEYKEIIIKEQRAKELINVVLITYNHSAYVEQAINSILEQSTDYLFNIIVADDCSTDDTYEKIRTIDAKTEVEFVYLSHEENVGTMNNYHKAFNACNGKFVAILEGDDYWIDSNKLQKMAVFLEEHSECSMISNSFYVLNEKTGTKSLQPGFTENSDYKILTGHDLAFSNFIGNFSTCMYRMDYVKTLPKDWYTWKGYDWLFNLLMSKLGKIGCLLAPMSVYRIHSAGLWSANSESKKYRDTIEVIDLYNRVTDYEYEAGFVAHKKRMKKLLFRDRIKRILHMNNIMEIGAKIKLNLRNIRNNVTEE